MPVSKHRKKGQTAQQFRKKRNVRRAQSAWEMKTERLGMQRAMQAAREELKNRLA